MSVTQYLFTRGGHRQEKQFLTLLLLHFEEELNSFAIFFPSSIIRYYLTRFRQGTDKFKSHRVHRIFTINASNYFYEIYLMSRWKKKLRKCSVRCSLYGWWRSMFLVRCTLSIAGQEKKDRVRFPAGIRRNATTLCLVNRRQTFVHPLPLPLPSFSSNGESAGFTTFNLDFRVSVLWFYYRQSIVKVCWKAFGFYLDGIQ